MMKPKKIMIGIPCNGGMQARFHLSVTNLAHQLIRRGWAVDINYEEGSLLSTQRNKIFAAARQAGCDLLFLDSDMVFAVEDALRLIDSDKSLIGGLYYGRRAPYMPLVFGEDLTDEKYVFRSIKDSDIPNEPFLCKGLGAGFLFVWHPVVETIWDWCEALKTRPFNFMELLNGDQYGEDLSFFRRCNEMELPIWCDPRGDIGHMTNKIIYRHDHQLHAQRDYHYCNDIEGWMTVKEQNWLYNTAREMESIIEVGCWKGKATHALACGCPGQVISVDHFQGSEGERDTYHQDAENAESEWTKNVGCRFSNVLLFKEHSLIAAKRSRPAEMIFIDAGHSYDEVKADLAAWESLATRLICGHDYSNFAGVQRAVNEYFNLDDIRVYESIWYVRKGTKNESQ